MLDEDGNVIETAVSKNDETEETTTNETSDKENTEDNTNETEDKY